MALTKKEVAAPFDAATSLAEREGLLETFGFS
jgi:hypothetical protein